VFTGWGQGFQAPQGWLLSARCCSGGVVNLSPMVYRRAQKRAHTMRPYWAYTVNTPNSVFSSLKVRYDRLMALTFLVLEPYHSGSHAAWLAGWQQHSAHHLQALTMPGNYWAWRMQGGAVTLARLYGESPFVSAPPALIIASDMLNLTTFLALTRRWTAAIPTALYFHENQLTYPPGPRQKRDLKLGFINYASALAADAVFFNSAFHRDEFLNELPRLLKHYADFTELQTVDQIAAKSQVLPVGIDLRRLDAYGSVDAKLPPTRPAILWNHRWEFDKNPAAFYHALCRLREWDIPFDLILLGEDTSHSETLFQTIQREFADCLLHAGYAQNDADYAHWLWQAHIAVSCAWQDFFGISAAEAIYCGCLPLLPRRLNYPDLLPASQHERCLYSEGDLARALRHEIAALPVQPPDAALRQRVAAYDWSVLARVYDAAFEKIGL